MHRILTLVLLLLPMLVSAQSLGTVNGEPIDTAEYRRRVERATAAWTHRLDPEEELGLRQSIWEQMVDEMILLQGAQRLGVAVDREAFERMQREADPNDDPRDIRNRWLEYVSDRVGDVLAPDARPTEEEMRELYAREAVIASGTVAWYEWDVVNDAEIEISDEEIDAYLASHREQRRARETRELRYVELVPRPSAQDTAATLRRLHELRARLEGIRSADDRAELHDEWTREHGDGQFLPGVDLDVHGVDPGLIDALRRATTGSIIGPLEVDGAPRLVEVLEADEDGRPMVRVTQIYIRMPRDSAMRDSARRVAAALADRARSGDDFDALVEEYSAPGGGDLGWFTERTMVEEFSRAVFAAREGAVVGPIETEYGYHVATVTDRQSRRYRVRDWRLDVEASEGPRADARAHAERIRRALVAGDEPDEIARREDVQFLMTGPIRRNDQAAQSVRLGRFVFDARAGEVSPVLELGRRFVVAQLAVINDSITTARADSRSAARRALIVEKRIDRLMARAGALRAGLPRGGRLEPLGQLDRELQIHSFVAETFVTSIADDGDSALARAVFTIPLGEVSQPIRGNRGIHLVRVDSRRPRTEEDLPTMGADALQQAIDGRRFEAFSEWWESERESAVITGWPE